MSNSVTSSCKKTGTGWHGLLVLGIFLSGFGLATWGVAADLQATVSLEPGVTPFHRPVVYTIQVDIPPEVDVTVPELPSIGKEVRVAFLDESDTALPGGGRRITRQYLLDPIHPATYTVPGYSVALDNGERLAIPAVAFEARALTDAELNAVAQVAPMALPREVLPPQSLRGWVLLLLLLVAAGLLAWYWWMQRKVIEEAPIRMPWEVAEARLQELAQRKLAEAGRFEAYYVDLSAILRYYIEDRFHLRAPEQTTQEFLEAAAKSGRLSADQQNTLADFLEQSDRVKFARYIPGEEEMVAAFGFVRGFVAETRPQTEALGEVGEAAA